jgi:hypothetical protein
LAKDSKNAPEGTEGFLTDLEFARMPVSTVEVEEVPAVRKARNIMTLPTTRKRETFHGRGAILTVCPLIKDDLASLAHHHSRERFFLWQSIS